MFKHNPIESSDPWFSDFWDRVEAGGWESETFRVFDQYLTSGTTYIDLGAWVGPTVLYAASRCKTCYAFEPDPAAYRQLCANIALNGFTNIITFNEAVLDYDGCVTLGSNELGNSMTRMNSFAQREIRTVCRTLDSFASTQELPGPLFMKMDIEGAEELVLRSIEFFRKYKPTLYLSLHPAWFVDMSGAVRTINEVKSLYRQTFVVNVDGERSSHLFTDE